MADIGAKTARVGRNCWRLEASKRERGRVRRLRAHNSRREKQTEGKNTYADIFSILSKYISLGMYANLHQDDHREGYSEEVDEVETKRGS